MEENDYYSVMKKRIEYFARKYDPYENLNDKEEPVPEVIEEQKQKKMRQKISAGISYIISFLF